MSAVFDRYPNGGGEMVLALALADHADDAGGSIFPSVPPFAKKTRQSKRSVQYQLRKMEQSGWLVLVAYEGGGRGRSREYRIHPAWVAGKALDAIKNENIGQQIKSATFAPMPEDQTAQYLHPIFLKRVQPTTKRVQPTTQKGATAIAPEPSGTIIEPSINPQQHMREGEFAMNLDWQPSGLFADRCSASGINLASVPQDNLIQLFGEFKSYWLTQPNTHTQTAWEHKLLQRITFKHRDRSLYDEAGESSCGASQEHARNDTSWIYEVEFDAGG